MSEGRTCPNCGAALPANAPPGQCPSSLLRIGLALTDGFSGAAPTLEISTGDNSALRTPQSALQRLRYFGDYELLEVIAQGGMGVVYKARQVTLNRVVAVKMIRAGVLASEADIHRFRSEAEAAGSLRHPHIVAIHEVGEHEGQHFFSMNYIEGKSLAESVREHPWPAERAATCVKTIAEAIHYSHQRGILHRDLKPSNVMVDVFGAPHITDFGLAKRIEEDSQLTASGAVVGTPSYMAPEQTVGKRASASAASDVYSMGAILYELLTSRPPFQGETPLDTLKLVRETEPVSPRLLNPKVPRDLETICLKCLEKEPKRRYASAQELADDLNCFLRHEPIRARPSNTFDRTAKWIIRKPAAAALAGMSCVAVLALIGVLLARVAFHAEQTHRKKVEAALGTAERAREAEEVQRKLKQSALMDAERSRSAEAEARAKEAEQRRIAEDALGKLEKSQYFRRIAWAQREWEANNVAYADQLLEECPLALRHWEWHYLNRLCHSEVLSLSGFTNGVQAFAVTTNGQRIAALSEDGIVKILDPRTSLEDVAFNNKLQGVESVAFSPSGIHLVVGNTNGVMDRWEIPTATKSWSSKARGRSISTLAYSADGRRLVSAGREGSITIFDGESGALLASSFEHGEAVNTVAISSDGNLIVSGSGRPSSITSSGISIIERSGVIKVWDARTGQLLFTLNDSVNVVHCVRFRSDDKYFASAHEDGTVRLWDVKSGKAEFVFHDHIGAALDVAFDANGTRLISGGTDRTIRLRRLPTVEGGVAHTYRTPGATVRVEGAIPGLDEIQPQAYTYRGHVGAVQAVAFVPSSGGSVVSGGSDGLIKIWDVANAPEAKKFNAVGSDVTFAPNSQSVATKSGVWNVLTARSDVAKVESRSNGTGYGRVKFGPNGKPIAGGYGVAITPDGKIIASSQARTAKLRDFATDTEIDSFSEKTNDIYDLAFSPDGKLLALGTGNFGPNMTSGGQPGAVQLWDWKAHKLIKTLPARRFAVWGLAFTTDGKRLASAGGLYKGAGTPRLGEVQVWDVETGKEVFDLAGVSDNVFNVAFSPDGKRLIAASGTLAGRTPVEVKIWDMDSGLVAFTLRGFDRPVHGVAFSPDGKRIATVGGGTLKIFSPERPEFDPLPGLKSAYESYSSLLADSNVASEARTGALLNRSQVLQHLKRPAEAMADLRSARNTPQRTPDTPANCIDLSMNYNARLNENWHFDGNPLSIPPGIQRLAGIDFDVRGLIQVGANTTNGVVPYPKQVSGIIIARRCEQLHFLHSAIYAPSATNGVQMGAYVVHYADGQQQEIPIRGGIDVGDWWTHSRETNTHFTVAWMGTNEKSLKYERFIRLFKTTWKNPRPDVEIVSIDFLSARVAPPGRGVPAPFLVAITAEP